MHGRLGEGEGDMRYLLPPGADAVSRAPLCRPLSPVDDLRALVRICPRIPRVCRRTSSTRTWPRPACSAGWRRRAYNRTRGAAPRARVVHTYHGHVLEGYFSPLKTRVFIALERALARAQRSRSSPFRRPFARNCSSDYDIGRADQYRVVPLGFDLAAFAAIDDDGARGARARPRDCLPTRRSSPPSAG